LNQSPAICCIGIKKGYAYTDHGLNVFLLGVKWPFWLKNIPSDFMVGLVVTKVASEECFLANIYSNLLIDDNRIANTDHHIRSSNTIHGFKF